MALTPGQFVILYGPLFVIGLLIVSVAGSLFAKGAARRRWRWTLLALLLLSLGCCAVVTLGLQGLAY